VSAEWKPLAGQRFFLAPVDYAIAVGSTHASVRSMEALITALGGERATSRKGATVLGPKKGGARGRSPEKLYDTVRMPREISERWLRDRERYDASLRAYMHGSRQGFGV